MARRTARKSKRKSRKSKRRGRRSRRRQRGGHGVAQNASPVDTPIDTVQEGGEEAPLANEPPKQKGGKRRKGRKTSKKQKGGKRKLNAYFKAMLSAKKSNAKSFKYKGKTYKGRKHARLGMIYSKG